jgi:hypothetical protein
MKNEHTNRWDNSCLGIGVDNRIVERDFMSACADCGCKASDGWALYCLKCSESHTESETKRLQELTAKTSDMAAEIKRLQEREWVGLTDGEVTEMFCDYDGSQFPAFVRAIETKLKEKNHA